MVPAPYYPGLAGKDLLVVVERGGRRWDSRVFIRCSAAEIFCFARTAPGDVQMSREPWTVQEELQSYRIMRFGKGLMLCRLVVARLGSTEPKSFTEGWDRAGGNRAL